MLAKITIALGLVGYIALVGGAILAVWQTKSMTVGEGLVYTGLLLLFAAGFLVILGALDDR